MKTHSGENPLMPKYFWAILGTLSALVIALIVGLSLHRSSAGYAELRDQLAQTQAELLDARTQLAEAANKLAQSVTRIESLEQEKAAAVREHEGLESEMRAALESKDVTISQLQGKLTVDIVDRILFDSGEAVLKPDGEAVLQKVAGILAQHPKLKVHVIGHTDNVPIRAGSRSRFSSNWELSAARALAAVRFLAETAGVDPQRLGAVGYGEFRPIADNSTSDGRARNRRIAITILPDELAGLDSVATARTNALHTVPATSPDTNTPAHASSSLPDDVSFEKTQ